MDENVIYDVLIIGGGIIGCAVLRELTLRGYRCILCEKNYQFVSGASCGMNQELIIDGTHLLFSESIQNEYNNFRKQWNSTYWFRCVRQDIHGVQIG